ncbi:unnamed protein product [Pedinophyceae sp. YPF-701]|nr:unnamed protein product [Pedinophyceae sp. YPF-701]
MGMKSALVTWLYREPWITTSLVLSGAAITAYAVGMPIKKSYFAKEPEFPPYKAPTSLHAMKVVERQH